MTPSQDALFDLKKRHLENGVMGGGGFPNGHIGSGKFKYFNFLYSKGKCIGSEDFSKY